MSFWESYRHRKGRNCASLHRYRSWITPRCAADDRKVWDFRISSQARCNASFWRCSSVTGGASAPEGQLFAPAVFVFLSAVFSSTKDGHLLFFFPFSASYSQRGFCPEETEGELGPASTPTTAPVCIRRGEESTGFPNQVLFQWLGWLGKI